MHNSIEFSIPHRSLVSCRGEQRKTQFHILHVMAVILFTRYIEHVCRNGMVASIILCRMQKAALDIGIVNISVNSVDLIDCPQFHRSPLLKKGATVRCNGATFNMK